jgi:Ca2+-binding RTX toxin-like protein
MTSCYMGADLLVGGDDRLNGEYDDVLLGGTGNDKLNGGMGNDRMAGGSGDDTYIVDAAADLVEENAAEGRDTVQSSITFTLSDNVENLTLTGSPSINGTGNALDNLITGNNGGQPLNGGAGNDTLVGNGGDDTLDGGTAPTPCRAGSATTPMWSTTPKTS